MAGLDLKKIGSTLDSIGSATIKPLINKTEDMFNKPFDMVSDVIKTLSNNPMVYVLIGGVVLVVITTKK